MTAIDAPNEMINNLAFITAEFGEGRFVDITYFNKDGSEITSVLHAMTGTDFKNKETLAELSELVHDFYMTRTDVVDIGFIILNPSSMEDAVRLGQEIIIYDDLIAFSINSIISTDTVKWSDVTSGDEGEVDRMEVTDFQLRSIVDGDVLKDYPVY